MKYTDKTSNFVKVGHKTIPRNHRLWYELEIDKAEKASAIEEYVEPEVSYIELRSAAYKAESDTLHFEGAYTGDLSKWRAKVDEIKKRYPKTKKGNLKERANKSDL